jgi:hypothetical protein
MNGRFRADDDEAAAMYFSGMFQYPDAAPIQIIEAAQIDDERPTVGRDLRDGICEIGGRGQVDLTLRVQDHRLGNLLSPAAKDTAARSAGDDEISICHVHHSRPARDVRSQMPPPNACRRSS